MLKIAWAENYAHSLPANHRFPMIKYELLPKQLMHEGTITKQSLFSPTAVPERYITLTHTLEYWHKLKNLQLSRQEIRRTGFPLSQALVEREITITGGTIQAALFALRYGIAFNIAGGTHHAFTNRGEGFCLLNDIAIAANYLLFHKLARRILIIDLDVHQGNGTAEICKNNRQVFTFSMHGDKNYPLQKEVSTLDIPLADNIGDTEYLMLLEQAIAGPLKNFNPDFIFYQSGVDILATDKLGRLGLSLQACKQRDEKVLQFAKRLGVPICCAMGGGYSPSIIDIVEAHANTYRLAQYIFFN
jgi:acetoin utilization deacetylase AcuC-like enzyme